jgi:hypothetical protein
MSFGVTSLFYKQALNKVLVDERRLPQEVAINRKCHLFVGTVPYGRRNVLCVSALRSTQFSSSLGVCKFIIETVWRLRFTGR